MVSGSLQKKAPQRQTAAGKPEVGVGGAWPSVGRDHRVPGFLKRFIDLRIGGK
jgi:hypothetical protein